MPLCPMEKNLKQWLLELSWIEKREEEEICIDNLDR